ncbi:hypothetical protein RJJ65_35975, partial [Rhizobium hidalgonense]
RPMVAGVASVWSDTIWRVRFFSGIAVFSGVGVFCGMGAFSDIAALGKLIVNTIKNNVRNIIELKTILKIVKDNIQLSIQVYNKSRAC